MVFTTILFLLSILNVLYILYSIRIREKVSFVLAFWVIYCSKLMISAYILSLVHTLSAAGFFIVEIICFIVLILILRSEIFSAAPYFFISAIFSFDFKIIAKSKILVSFFIGVSLIYAYSLFVAIFLPPLNHDALSYHIPRVFHWLAQGDLSHYPTSDFRQNELPPNNAILLMWTYIITGVDWFFNSVQWISSIVCAAAIYGISRTAQLSRKAALFSALVFLCYPMVLLQSSTSQSDLIVTSFFLSMIYFLLKYFESNKSQHLWLSGLSFGIAIGTKITVFFALPAIGIMILLICYRKYKFTKKCLQKIGAICICYLIGFVLLGSYNYIQNTILYGNPLSSPYNVSDHSNSSLDFEGAVSNAVKYTYQMFDFTGFPKNASFTQFVADQQSSLLESFTRFIGLDLNANNYTHNIFTPTAMWLNPHEDTAGFGFIAFLLLGAGLFVRVKEWKIKACLYVSYTWFLFFVFLVPWTSHKTRYFILPIALSVILIGYLWDKKFKHNKTFVILIAAVSLYIGVFVSLNNANHNLDFVKKSIAQKDRDLVLQSISPNFTLFHKILPLFIPEKQIVGIDIPGNSMEYLLWNGLKPIHLQYIDSSKPVQSIVSKSEVKYLLTNQSVEDDLWIDIPGTEWKIYLADDEGYDFWELLLDKYDISQDSSLFGVQPIDQEHLEINRQSLLWTGVYSDGWSQGEIDVIIPRQLLNPEDLFFGISISGHIQQEALIDAYVDGVRYPIFKEEDGITVLLPATTHKNYTKVTFLVETTKHENDARDLGIHISKLFLNRYPQIISDSKINLLGEYILSDGMYGDNWTAGHAQLIVPAALSDYLAGSKMVIKFNYIPPRSNNLKVLVNDVLVKQMENPEPEVVIDLSQQLLNRGENRISILSDTFVPHEVIEGSEDKRKLGANIAEIYLELPNTKTEDR